MLMIALALVCLVGAAAAGWFITLGQKTTSWYHFEILGTGGHGFMLGYMGVVALFNPMPMHGMMTAAAASAIPMIARGFLKLFGLGISSIDSAG